jgi:hypothetical protein
MATITFDGNKVFKLVYQFTSRVVRSDYGEGRFSNGWQKTVPGTQIAYVIVPAFTVKKKLTAQVKPGQLVITGKEIVFEGRISGVPRLDLPNWKAGVLQTIYKSERIARYEGGFNRIVRLNTNNGPLADQEEGDAPFACDRKEPIRGTYIISTHDAPNFDMPLYAGLGNAKLQSTSGEDSFCTFLVLVREQDKSIIELSRISWKISWEGNFNWRDHKDWREENPWSPRDVNAFFQVQQPQATGNLYEKIKFTPYLPFSLKTTPAAEFRDIFEGGKWTRTGVQTLDTWISW